MGKYSIKKGFSSSFSRAGSFVVTDDNGQTEESFAYRKGDRKTEGSAKRSAEDFIKRKQMDEIDE